MKRTKKRGKNDELENPINIPMIREGSPEDTGRSVI